MARRLTNDLSIYEEYGSEWWDPNSRRFRSLQAITTFRLETIDTWFGDLSGLTVIDLGCGGGLLAVPLAQRGAKVIGIDLSYESLHCAKTQANPEISVLKADARRVPLKDGCADVVLLADVLDHLPDYPRALEEASRLLKPAGRVYVNTINRTLASRILAILLGETFGLIPKGTHEFSLFIKPTELDAAAAECALKLEHRCGEFPKLLQTLKTWAIHFRGTTNTSVAYSAMFTKS